MQRLSGTGLEPVNGAMISWRDASFWWSHITKPQKGHTHTHTHPYKTSSRIRPSLVLLRDFAHLPLLGRNKSDQGEESGTEPSSCVSCGPSSVEAEGVPVVGEDANSDTFYRIVMLAWHVMNQWLFLLKTLVVEVIFDILLGRAELSWYFVILITRIVLGDAQVTLDPWPVEWVRNHNTHPIFQGQEDLFSFISWGQTGICCPGHTFPTLVIVFLIFKLI